MKPVRLLNTFLLKTLMMASTSALTLSAAPQLALSAGEHSGGGDTSQATINQDNRAVTETSDSTASEATRRPAGQVSAPDQNGTNDPDARSNHDYRVPGSRRISQASVSPSPLG